MVRCGSGNVQHKKYMRLKEIRLHAQNMLIVLGSMVNIHSNFLFFLGGGEVYDQLTRTRIFSLMTKNIFMCAPKFMRRLLRCVI